MRNIYLSVMWDTIKMVFGSYIRFGLGLIISTIVLLSFFANETVSLTLAALAIIYLILVVAWFAFRF